MLALLRSAECYTIFLSVCVAQNFAYRLINKLNRNSLKIMHNGHLMLRPQYNITLENKTR